MKILLYADPHFTQSSSIIVGRKGEFTGRLNNLIETFDWINRIRHDFNINYVVCLGDMTDKPILTAEEITAMSKCHLEDHYMIVGNHCRSNKNGEINSLSIYDKVISSPQFIDAEKNIYVLPYGYDLVNIKEISPRPRIILSHNDLKGYDFGNSISKEGYEVSDILDSCDLFINGHLHNGGWIVPGRIMNLGAISGMNFSSCGGQWEPSVGILDTETLEVELIENPKAYKFKKVSFDTIPKLKGYLDNLKGGHYVLQVKVPSKISEQARKLVDQCDKVEACRILVIQDREAVVENKVVFEVKKNTIYEQLKEFIHSQNPKYSLEKIDKIIEEISSQEDKVE